MEILYGRRPVLESLRAARRAFRRLIIDQRTADSDSIQTIIGAAKNIGVTVETQPRSWLNSRTGGSNHQGVALEADDYPYSDIPGILAYAEAKEEPVFVLFLDLLQDVQNVGTLLRTAEAVGVHGVIIQERRAADITPAVVSASSGAVEHLPIAQVTNLVRSMEQLKEEAEMWIYGLDQSADSKRFDQANLKGNVGLTVGSEGQGLRRLVRETCDTVIHLPMKGRIESLNASIAGSVALYEAWRARDFG